jgi:hypothetical protein
VIREGAKLNTHDMLSNSMRCFRYLVPVLAILFLAACGPRDSAKTTKGVGQSYFQPPTLADIAPLSSSTPVGHGAIGVDSPQLNPTPQCTNNLTYIQDITIPDSTSVTPGQTLDKRWRIQNSGTCNWDERYRMKMVAGPGLGAPVEQALYPARSGSEAVIRIMFTAPADMGAYRSAWQAYDPQGEPFGDPFFIEVIVTNP